MAKTFANPLDRQSAGTTAALGDDVTLLAPNAIRTDGGTQMRANLDRATVTEYADAMRRGTRFPAVEVYYDGADHWLGDGFHRLLAHQEAHGFKIEIAAVVKAGTRRDAILAAAGANAAHGLRRSDADKARAVDALLADDEWGQWSDREIARRCNVSHPFVAKRRVLLPPSEDAGQRTYVTGHGTTATMKTAGIASANRGRADLTGNISSQVAGENADDDAGQVESRTVQDGIAAHALPLDLLALGWQINQVGDTGNMYGYRPRVGDRSARATSTTTDFDQIMAEARQIDAEDASRIEESGDESDDADALRPLREAGHSPSDDTPLAVTAPVSAWAALHRHLAQSPFVLADNVMVKTVILRAIDEAVEETA